MAKKKPEKEELGGEAFKRKLKSDDTFQAYRKIIKSILERVDLEKLEEEMIRLHSGRLSRNLKGTNPSADKIIQATTQDSSVRSRLVEIRVSLSKHKDRVEMALEATKQYLAQAYSEEVASYRTKEERKTYFNTYLTTGVTLHHNLESLIDRFDQIIKDIDQCGFTYRNIIQCLEMVLSRNNNRTSV